MADGAQETADIVLVMNWASGKKISMSAAQAVVDMGYTSMEAWEGVSMDDLKKANVVVGQRKLIMKAVAGLVTPPPDTPNPASDEGAGLGSSQEAAPTPLTAGTDPTSLTVNSNIVQGNPTSGAPSGDDAFTLRLLESLRSVPGGSMGGGQLGGPGEVPVPQVPSPPLQGMLSWQDPQVYLKSVANSKSQCYNIVDFVDVNHSTSERVLSAGEDMEIICRSGSRKPKLEGLTISQWSLANIAILYKLFQDNSIKMEEVFDYLSYTSHIYGLIGTHELASVYYYDREYRRLQATHKFRWGTAIGHLAPSYLRLRPATQVGGARPRTNQRPDGPPQRAPFMSRSSEGRTICKNYNSTQGCTFKGCRFDHACSIPGCGRGHPRCSHGESKN